FPSLFATVDKKHKIFSKKLAATKLHYDFPTIPSHREGRIAYTTRQQPERVVPKAAHTLQQEADRIVLEHHAPAGLVINREMEIVHFRGRTSPYVEPAPGRATLDLLKMARGGLPEVLRSVINQAAKKGSAQRKNVSFEHNGRGRSINIFVEQLNVN